MQFTYFPCFQIQICQEKGRKNAIFPYLSSFPFASFFICLKEIASLMALDPTFELQARERLTHKALQSSALIREAEIFKMVSFHPFIYRL